MYEGGGVTSCISLFTTHRVNLCVEIDTISPEKMNFCHAPVAFWGQTLPDPTLVLPHQGEEFQRVSVTSIFGSIMSRMAYFTPSLPRPESLIPP